MHITYSIKGTNAFVFFLSRNNCFSQLWYMAASVSHQDKLIPYALFSFISLLQPGLTPHVCVCACSLPSEQAAAVTTSLRFMRPHFSTCSTLLALGACAPRPPADHSQVARSPLTNAREALSLQAHLSA